MKNVKKIISLLLVCVLVISLGFNFSVFAETLPLEISVSSHSVQPGESVEVSVALKNNPGIASLKLIMSFDSALLTLDKITYNSAMGGNFTMPQKLTAPVVLMWVSPFKSYDSDGVFATLSFKVNELADKDTKAEITLSYNPNDIYDMTENNVETALVNGAVFIGCVHSFTDYVFDGNVSCTQDGTKTALCDKGCGAKDTVEQIALGHDYVRDTERDLPATELTTGIEAYTCSRCGAHNDKITEQLKAEKIQVEETDKVKIFDSHTILVVSNLTMAELEELVTPGVEFSTLPGVNAPFTGMTLTLKNSQNQPVDTVKVILMGDLDKNGKISAGDARLALRQSVGLEQLDWEAEIAAKVCGAETVRAAQARLILRASVGLDSPESLLVKQA